MKKITLFTFVAVFAMAFIGCTRTQEVNSNHAVVVNSTTNGTMMNSNMMNSTAANTSNPTGTGTTGTGTMNRYNANMTRAEYEKNQAQYETDRTGSKIGTGANDKWLWFKTKAALTSVDELRDSTINVDVDNNIVTLRGTVASKAEVDKAVAAAKGIEGVKDVKSVMTIQKNDSLTNQTMGGANGTTKTNTTNSNMKH